MNGALTRAEVRELDRRAIEDYGIPSVVLMENAGRECAREALSMLETTAAEPVVVVCGPGNNGGDGLVIARTLVNRGVPVEVFFVGDGARLQQASADVRTNLALWKGLGRPLRSVPDSAGLEALIPALERAPLVVDALFGTGLSRPLGPPWTTAVETINGAARPVLAVDLPSGLDADTGEILGAAIRADTTVTFVAAKPGLTLGAGPGLCGRVVVAEIGIPRSYLVE